jgi:SRSO17 transposase
MLQAIRSKGRLPCKYLVADCLYGKSPDVLDAVDSCLGVTSLVSMSAETRCWLQRPLTTDKTYTSRGEVRTKRLVAAETQAPVTVAALAQRLASSCWYRRTVSEGTKGPIAYAFARTRVTLRKEGLPDRSVWLVLKRTLGAEPTYWYSLSNAPASAPLRLFVWLSGVRWSIEQGFEETKTALGMAQYEGRTYPGWYHHRLTCM